MDLGVAGFYTDWLQPLPPEDASGPPQEASGEETQDRAPGSPARKAAQDDLGDGVGPDLRRR